MVLLGSVNEIKHVRADQDCAELLEVAMLFVFNLSDTPSILPALSCATIGGLDIFLRANDGERHGCDETAGVLQTGVIIFLKRWLVDLDALGLNDTSYLNKVSNPAIVDLMCTDPLLELGQISRAQGISLGNDWNEIDTSAQSLHNLNVQWLEGVSSRSDEVEACMHAQVDLLGSARLLLLQHVGLMLIIEKLDDGLP